MTVVDVDAPESPDDATLAALKLPELELPDSPTASHLKNPLAKRHLSPSRFLLQQRLSEHLELASQQSGSDSPDRDRASSSCSTPSPAKMKRFLPTASQEGGLEKWNAFYSDEAVKQRVKLMKHPRVKLALDDLWTAANFNADDDIIDRDEYLMMHRKIVLALEPSTAPAEAAAAALEDWPRDSEGKAGLDKERFSWAWFELADLWTNTMEAEEYEDFLTSTMELITKRATSGAVVWRDDQDVMRAHFRRRRELGLRVSEEGSLNVCVARWHKFFKDQGAAKSARPTGFGSAASSRRGSRRPSGMMDPAVAAAATAAAATAAAAARAAAPASASRQPSATARSEQQQPRRASAGLAAAEARERANAAEARATAARNAACEAAATAVAMSGRSSAGRSSPLMMQGPAQQPAATGAGRTSPPPLTQQPPQPQQRVSGGSGGKSGLPGVGPATRASGGGAETLQADGTARRGSGGSRGNPRVVSGDGSPVVVKKGIGVGTVIGATPYRAASPNRAPGMAPSAPGSSSNAEAEAEARREAEAVAELAVAAAAAAESAAVEAQRAALAAEEAERLAGGDDTASAVEAAEVAAAARRGLVEADAAAMLALTGSVEWLKADGNGGGGGSTPEAWHKRLQASPSPQPHAAQPSPRASPEAEAETEAETALLRQAEAEQLRLLRSIAAETDDRSSRREPKDSERRETSLASRVAIGPAAVAMRAARVGTMIWHGPLMNAPALGSLPASLAEPRACVRAYLRGATCFRSRSSVCSVMRWSRNDGSHPRRRRWRSTARSKEGRRRQRWL